MKRRALVFLTAAVILAVAGILLLNDLTPPDETARTDAALQKDDAPTEILKVGITQIASHPSLNAVRRGIVEGLASRGWTEGDNISFLIRDANRDPSLALPIAQSFVDEGVVLIIPITTPSALAARQATKEIPVVFGGVTDPVGIGLVESFDNPGHNITGTSDRWPFESQLRLFLQLVPNLKKLGMLFSPGDEVSEVAVQELSALCPQLGVELIKIPVSTSQDIYSAARRLLLQADAIYTGLDTLVVENVESVFKAAREASKPVFAGDEGTVERGALATFGISMEDLGIETAKLADRVLRGEPAGDIPVTVVVGGYPIINREALEEHDIDVPEALRDTVKFVDSRADSE